MELDPRSIVDGDTQAERLVSEKYYSRLLMLSVFSVSLVAIVPLVVMTAVNYYQYQEAFHSESIRPVVRFTAMGKLSLEDFTPAGLDFLREARDAAVIDVTSAENATAGNGHWYFMSSPWVSSDLLLLFKTGGTPDERGLE